MAAGRPGDAIGPLRSALALADETIERSVLLLQLGRALHDLGELANACDVLESAMSELAPLAADSGRAAELHIQLEAAYVTSAVQSIGVGTVQDRVARYLSWKPETSSAAQLGLMSKAILAQAWAGHNSSGWQHLLLPLVNDRRLTDDPRADSQSLWHLSGAAMCTTGTTSPSCASSAWRLGAEPPARRWIAPRPG